MKKAKPISKKWIWISVVIAVAVYSLIGFVIWPTMARLSSDTVYEETMLPSMLDYVSDVLETGVLSLFYGTLIVLLYRYNGGMLALCTAFSLVTIYKHLINTVMTWINSGGLSLEWYFDLADVLFYTLIEITPLLIVYLIIKRFIEEHALLREARLRFSKDDGGGAVSFEEPYPYRKLFSVKNCLLRSALVCAIVTFAAKVSGVLISDLWDIVIGGGLPDLPQTWLLMLMNYLSMILSGVLVYFFTVGATAVILRKKPEETIK